MNDTSPIDWNTINLLLEQLPLALNKCRTERAQLVEQIDNLAATYCTGKEHWRDANKSKHAPKLYVIHRTDVACPIHGTPDPGKRIRTYIGSRDTKIEAARAAIAQGLVYLQAKTNLRRINRNLWEVTHTLKRIYWTLDLKVPTFPPDPAE